MVKDNYEIIQHKKQNIKNKPRSEATKLFKTKFVTKTVRLPPFSRSFEVFNLREGIELRSR